MPSDDLFPATPVSPNRFPFSFYSDNGTTDADYFNRLKTESLPGRIDARFRARSHRRRTPWQQLRPAFTDLLGVSLSAHDYINHAYGPESKMSHDHLQRLDRLLADFLSFVDRKVGTG